MERRRLLDNVSSEEYQVLAYIESTATDKPYIDTGVALGNSNNIRFESDIVVSYSSASGTTCCIGLSASGGHWWGMHGGRYALTASAKINNQTPGQRVIAISTFTSNKNTLQIGNSTISTTATISKTQTYKTLVPAYTQVSVRYYGLKVYRDNVLTHDFVPCKRLADGEIGLFETVSGQFYSKLGTGVFSYSI